MGYSVGNGGFWDIPYVRTKSTVFYVTKVAVPTRVRRVGKLDIKDCYSPSVPLFLWRR